MSRQQADYPAEQSIRDAVALVAALMHDPGLTGIGEDALRASLDQTDHTALALNLGTLSALLLRMAADAQGRAPEDLLQQLALAIAEASS